MVNLPTLFDASTVAPVTPDFMSTDGLSSEADHLAATRYRFVPADMRAAPCWMVARIVAGDNSKALKVPHRVTRGAGGGVSVLALAKGEGHNDPATHCTFADAIEAIVADPALELGFALGTGNDFACVDLDDLDKVALEHRDGATEQHRLIREGLTPLTYSEVSRSGKGWHFIGRWPEAPPDLNRKKHAKFEAELLVRQFLVVTGDHRADVQGATTEVAEIGDKFDGVYRWILAGDGPATGVATLPADGVITPGRVTDAKQLRLILSAGKNGEAFRDGRRANDWSTTFKAILNATAQFCTDEQLTYQVIATSGLVQLAEDKGSVSRIEKLDRLWAKEWRDSLIKTEPSRRADAAAHVDIGPLTLADLWDSRQSGYVKFRVQQRAEDLITEGLYRGTDAGTLAPLFRYLTPERQNSLTNLLRAAKKDDMAKLCLDACILAQSDTTTEVIELNDFMGEMIAEEKRISVKVRFKEYNEKFYIVENYGGSAMVFRDAFHPESGAQEFWRPRAFQEAKVHELVLLSFNISEDKPHVERFARMWTESPKARRYAKQEMRFETTDRVVDINGEKVFNLFQGWATMPVAGTWPAIHYLIRDIICSGSVDATEYLLNYMAHMVQKPHVLPGTAVILQSEEQGTGKSTFMALLRKLLGSRYCASTSDADHFVGPHNDRALNKVLLHFEEAVAPNDRKIESKIKALITNETASYNPKGIAVIEARNFARVFMTSNAQQVAHLARHDRRMFVLNVSAKHANDAAFWSAAHEAFPQEMEAFMHALRTRDISTFRPSVIPFTQAKDKQKMASVVGPERVLFDFLEAGRLPACSHFDGRAWEVRVTALTEHFIKNSSKVGHSYPQPARVFAPVALSPVRVRRINVSGQASKSWRVLTLPKLTDARMAFLVHQNVSAYDWGDGMEDWALD